jgi:hypothetical protein
MIAGDDIADRHGKEGKAERDHEDVHHWRVPSKRAFETEWR